MYLSQYIYAYTWWTLDSDLTMTYLLLNFCFEQEPRAATLMENVCEPIIGNLSKNNPYFVSFNVIIFANLIFFR